MSLRPRRIIRDGIEYPRRQSQFIVGREIDQDSRRGCGENRGAIFTGLRRVRPNAVRAVDKQVGGFNNVEFTVQVDQAQFVSYARKFLLEPGFEQAINLTIVDIGYDLIIADQVTGSSLLLLVRP